MLTEVEMGLQKLVTQVTNGCPIVGSLAELGVYPTRNCAAPESNPLQLLANSKWGTNARRAAGADPHYAVNHVDKGWLDGPLPLDEDGKVVTGEGPQPASPAFRFGVRQGKQLRVVDDLKEAKRIGWQRLEHPVNHPAWDHFAATIRTFQE